MCVCVEGGGGRIGVQVWMWVCARSGVCFGCVLALCFVTGCVLHSGEIAHTSTLLAFIIKLLTGAGKVDTDKLESKSVHCSQGLLPGETSASGEPGATGV